MHLPKNFSMALAAACLLSAAIAAAAAAQTTGSLPINKVWPRSNPGTRFLAPPPLLHAPATAQAVPAPFSSKLDVNRASLDDLQRLPGVGPAMGAHIMAGRPFRTLGDLARDGVPFDTIDQIAPLITFDP
jgi:competence protein ComEA